MFLEKKSASFCPYLLGVVQEASVVVLHFIVAEFLNDCPQLRKLVLGPAHLKELPQLQPRRVGAYA